ncbi:MAG TPA: hypothetical protein VNT55_02010 [Baekduia sp.]|nr:hypothetical protein [Baekduia sp.]
MHCKLGIVVAHDRDDLEQIGAAGRAEVEAGVVFLIVDCERVSLACSMSSSAMPCLRADGWISTVEL